MTGDVCGPCDRGTLLSNPQRTAGSEGAAPEGTDADVRDRPAQRSGCTSTRPRTRTTHIYPLLSQGPASTR